MLSIISRGNPVVYNFKWVVSLCIFESSQISLWKPECVQRGLHCSLHFLDTCEQLHDTILKVFMTIKHSLCFPTLLDLQLLYFCFRIFYINGRPDNPLSAGLYLATSAVSFYKHGLIRCDSRGVAESKIRNSRDGSFLVEMCGFIWQSNCFY